MYTRTHVSIGIIRSPLSWQPHALLDPSATHLLSLFKAHVCIQTYVQPTARFPALFTPAIITFVMDAPAVHHPQNPSPDRGRGRGGRGRGRRRNQRPIAAANREQHQDRRPSRGTESHQEVELGAGNQHRTPGEGSENYHTVFEPIGNRYEWGRMQAVILEGNGTSEGRRNAASNTGRWRGGMGMYGNSRGRGRGRVKRRGVERAGRERQGERCGGEKRGVGPGLVQSTIAATELSERLAMQMARGEVECVVCLEKVRRGAPMWSCGRCYVITHLHCARKWANAGTEAEGMCCPSCRAEQGSIKELVYRCFCGKRRNPVLEPGVLPGSCGDPCLKERGEEGSGCPHKCSALCHPGPCAPCLAQAPGQKCLCGQETIFRKCGEAIRLDGLKCGRICGKTRDCGHQCQSVCHNHSAEGGDCEVVVEVSCFCGGFQEKLPCGIGRAGFACGKTCGKVKECGKHYCEMLCHDGPCGECLTGVDKVKTCACGKVDITEEQRKARTSCLDPLPSCGDVCGRQLGCLKKHSCSKICGHNGSCGPCEDIVLMECRCAASTVDVKCGEDKEMLKKRLVCDRRCNELLLCRRHRCKNVCCMYKKRKGPPKPKVLSSDVVWLSSSAEAPSQTMSNTNRRRIGHGCQELCEKVLSCGLHNCDLICGHSGDCPPCGILSREPLFCACNSVSIPPPVRCGTVPPTCGKPCSKQRECGHKCPDECHPGDCAPCVENTRFQCVGGHGESRFVPCHIGAKGIKCSRTCGKPLQCGVHACRNQCHGDYPRNCELSTTNGCTQICALPRRTCDHSCLSSCHPDMICPDVPCRHMIMVTCPCGRRKEEAMCLRGGDGGARGIGDSVRLACDNECTAQTRLRAFATAVGRDGPSSGGSGVSGAGGSSNDLVKYSDFLLQFAEREPRILAYFEQEFAKVVKGKARKLMFEELPQLHRLVVHTMAEHYMLESESSGRAPTRKVVVRHRGVGIKPMFPNPLLSEALMCREKERKRQESGKVLVIHVASSTKQASTAGIEARVENELKAHAGAYRIIRKTTMSTSLTGVSVEFSTPERALLVRNTLMARPEVTIEDPVLLSKTLPTRSQGIALSEISETNSWNEGTQYSERGMRNGLPPPPPTTTDLDSINVPDSWDE